MYEVHPNDDGEWILYQVGGGDWLVVAWFNEKADAEFALNAFTGRKPDPPRCKATTKEGYQCEKVAGHDGSHYCGIGMKRFQW